MSRERKLASDVLHEATTDDYWNVDEDTSQSEPWIGVTRFELLKKNPPERQMWVRGRLTRKQVTARLGHTWPEECRKALSAKPSINERTGPFEIYFIPGRWSLF